MLGQTVGRCLIEQQQALILELARGGIEILAGGNFATVDRNEFCLKLLAVDFGEHAHQIPIGGGNERHAQPLALDDQAHRDALHAPGRQVRTDLAPQQGRDLIAVQAVEMRRVSCADQILVDVAWMQEGLFDGLFRDFVKHQPMDGHLGLQQLLQVPTDGLSLAVFVGGQVEVFGVLEQVCAAF